MRHLTHSCLLSISTSVGVSCGHSTDSRDSDGRWRSGSLPHSSLSCGSTGGAMSSHSAPSAVVRITSVAAMSKAAAAAAAAAAATSEHRWRYDCDMARDMAARHDRTTRRSDARWRPDADKGQLLACAHVGLISKDARCVSRRERQRVPLVVPCHASASRVQDSPSRCRCLILVGRYYWLYATAR